MALFGTKNAALPMQGERTILLLDIENGSAAAGLLRIAPGKQPRLFGEARSHAPLAMSRSGSSLANGVRTAVSNVLRSASQLAARMRNHPKTAPMGTVDFVAVVMSAPWGTPNLAGGKPDFMQDMADDIRSGVEGLFGVLPVSFYTSAGVSAFGTRALMTREPCLVCAVSGEVSELMSLDQDGVRAHATIPTGSHSLLRTLRTHGGLSEHEARSAARLPLTSALVREPARAAAGEFAAHFKDAAREFLTPGEVLRVAVIAEEPMNEWFAQALALDEALAELFPHGGEVRALRAAHAMPHLDAHSAAPDVKLLLGALFIDSMLGGESGR